MSLEVYIKDTDTFEILELIDPIDYIDITEEYLIEKDAFNEGWELSGGTWTINSSTYDYWCEELNRKSSELFNESNLELIV